MQAVIITSLIFLSLFNFSAGEIPSESDKMTTIPPPPSPSSSNDLGDERINGQVLPTSTAIPTNSTLLNILGRKDLRFAGKANDTLFEDEPHQCDGVLLPTDKPEREFKDE